MRPAGDLHDDELTDELRRLDRKIADFEAAPDDDKAHGGSPGEGMYERWAELESEQERRRHLDLARAM